MDTAAPGPHAGDLREVKIRRMAATYAKRHAARSAAWHVSNPAHVAAITATRAACRGPKPETPSVAAKAHAAALGAWATTNPKEAAAAVKYASRTHAARLRAWAAADPVRVEAREAAERQVAWRKKAILALANADPRAATLRD